MFKITSEIWNIICTYGGDYMASKNDFKLVKIKSKNYAKFLNLDENVDENMRARFGFYFLALECITNITDTSTLDDMIIDNEYCSQVKHLQNDDQGIDAVYIDHDNQVINFFNFKHRNEFNPDKSQSFGAITDSMKLLSYIQSSSTDGLNGITLEKTKQIIECLDSDDIWHMKLYIVSNESMPVKLEDTSAKSLEEIYDLDIVPLTLDDIVEFISNVPTDISAKFIADQEAVMTYEMDALSTSKSYLVKLTLADVIRITCVNDQFRNDTAIEYEKLKDQKLKMDLLFDNVRGYLGETKYNKNIIKTIKNEPNKFFMYNNGITITAQKITARPINGKRKTSVEISGFQIVNGGQTLRSIYEYAKNNFDENQLGCAEILVRIFQTEMDPNLKNNISEYTNSQNAISSIDLKSVSNLQFKLEKFLEEHNILYVRKNGDVGRADKEYEHRIGMEKVAQILYAYKGYPDRATNQKRYLFDKYYDEIFDEEKIDFSEVVKLINTYYEIESEYRKSGKDVTLQKCLYIIYMQKLLVEKTIIEDIEILEECIAKYSKGKKLSVSRILLYKEFKNNLYAYILKVARQYH